jgi:phosphotransferase system HPr (HPr) family protein
MGNSHRQTVTVTNPQGFHMRPMAAFVEVANRFPCNVMVSATRPASAGPVNGKSILALMSLVAVQGTELLIEVEGPESSESLDALVKVFLRNFDEDQTSEPDI